tara:strand:+ start:2396 stop:2875 length:480 start_codon:yes stop_codon:yes gene_type:complete
MTHKKIINLFTIFFILFTTSCGFKAIDNTKGSYFRVNEIKTYGDNRINYKIKNRILSNSSDKAQDSLIINLNTKKIKEVKEKNIKNEITKYDILIVVEVTLNFIENKKIEKFTLNSRGDYSVSEKYSTTLQNEKRLVDNLNDDISKKIINKISMLQNDI